MDNVRGRGWVDNGSAGERLADEELTPSGDHALVLERCFRVHVGYIRRQQMCEESGWERGYMSGRVGRWMSSG